VTNMCAGEPLMACSLAFLSLSSVEFERKSEMLKSVRTFAGNFPASDTSQFNAWFHGHV
jgi:hypothetical protein